MTGMTLADRFVDHLQDLAGDKNRGALAALRRGLGRAPGEAPEMFPYVVPWLPEHMTFGHEQAFYLTAALFAAHPTKTEQGNMGDHMAAAISRDFERAAVERRFVALLGSHIDDLPDMLRQTVSFLRSKDKPVNYRQLLRDLLGWSNPSRTVQRRWASGFWGRAASQEHPADVEAGATAEPAQHTE
jgi:CRISPR system Cascade subunit CasB